jgi:hypothetical protein
VGPQGPSGPQGERGLQGEQGLKGDAGRDGVNGLNGKDGAVGIQGPMGPQGPAGPQGERGANGAAGIFVVYDAEGQARPYNKIVAGQGTLINGSIDIQFKNDARFFTFDSYMCTVTLIEGSPVLKVINLRGDKFQVVAAVDITADARFTYMCTGY